MSEAETKPMTVKNYKDFIAAGQFKGSKCNACGNVDVPARMICSQCQSTDLDWLDLKGTGKLASFSCIHVGTTYFANLGYNVKKPYCFAIVELDEGTMVSAQLVGVDETKPETIQIGMPVKVKFLERTVGDATWTDLGFEPQ